MARMVYSQHALWFCKMCSTVGPCGRLRCALVIITPWDRRFHEFFGYRPPDERLGLAAQAIVAAYDEEAWHRRPREIRCATRELTGALKPFKRLEATVRTDRRARKFESATRRFEAYVEQTPLRRAWAS